MAAHARAKPRPVLLTGAWALSRTWRGWQRSRPFSGALLTIAGGTEILLVSWSEHGHGTRVIVPIGMLIAGGILACALLLLFDPAQRSVYATATILLAASAPDHRPSRWLPGGHGAGRVRRRGGVRLGAARARPGAGRVRPFPASR